MENIQNIQIMDLSVFSSIVILSGAGVSVESGVPDYRSGSGIFSKFGVECFSRSYRDRHPELIAHPDYIEFRRQMTDALPNDSHFLAKFLYDRGKLQRVITQNVDGLYQKTGLPEDRVIEFHGSFSKDTTVLYGDSIPKEVIRQTVDDMAVCDCVIIMGTSLQVYPFAAVPNLASKNCVRFLVDRRANELVTSFSNQIADPTSYNGPIKFGDKLVSTQQRWMRSQSPKWRQQYIVEDLCGVWAEKCMKAFQMDNIL